MPRIFEKLTADELRLLPPDQTVFFFPVGPLEDHGPHLPMGADLLEATRIAELAAERLEKEQPGWTGVVMPATPLGVDSKTSAISIIVRGHVLRDWLVDSCLSLWHAGFRNFVCFSGHLGPRQLTAIEEAGKMLRYRAGRGAISRLMPGRRNVPILVSASSAMVPEGEVKRSPFWPNPPEHAGKRDTSVALSVFPDQVRPMYSSLPPLKNDDSNWTRFWKRRRRQLSGYWGAPSEAQAELGSEELRKSLDPVFPKLRAVWEGANPEGLFRSWYSVLPPNRSFFRSWVLAFAVFILMLGWVYVSVRLILGE